MQDTRRLDREQDGTVRTGRALVVVGGEPTGSRRDGAARPFPSHPRCRADAAFLAQLLAVRTHAPEQRAKRRAAPEVGAAAYRTGLDLLANAPRRTLGIEA